MATTFGMLGGAGTPSRSIEELAEAAATGWAEKRDEDGLREHSVTRRRSG